MKELLERRAKILADMQAILDAGKTENRDITEAESAQFDALDKELTSIDQKIERMRRVETARAANTETIPAAGRGLVPGNGGRVAGGDVKKEFETLAEFVCAVRFNPNDQRLAALYHENVGHGDAQTYDPETGAAVDLRMDQGPTGGFMVPKAIRTQLMEVPAQDALVRPRATVIGADPGSPDAAVGMPTLDQSGASQPASNFGGVTVTWINEGDDKPQTDLALREIELVPKEVAAHIVVTDKLLRNWQGARPLIDRLFRGAINQAEDYAFVRGTGVGQPLGVLNAGVLYTVTRAGAGNIAFADIKNMIARFLMRGTGTPVWSCSQECLLDLVGLKDEANNLIWLPNARDGMAGQLMGYPLRINNRQPAKGTKGDIILADWGQYLIKDGSGPFVAASEHVYFLKNKTVVKVFYNVDGAPWMFEPHTEENGYDVSPFVAIAT